MANHCRFNEKHNAPPRVTIVLLASGDCRKDAHFITWVHGRLSVLKKPNIFVIHENVYEPANVILLIANAFFHTRITLLQIFDYVSYRRAFESKRCPGFRSVCEAELEYGLAPEFSCSEPTANSFMIRSSHPTRFILKPQCFFVTRYSSKKPRLIVRFRHKYSYGLSTIFQLDLWFNPYQFHPSIILDRLGYLLTGIYRMLQP